MFRNPRVDCRWSRELAYVVGVFASDGNLSSDGRHLNVTSKDREMVETVRDLLKLDNKIGRKARGGEAEKKYFVFQFGDITFYEFLVSIGLTPAKSKTIGPLAIPDRYYCDFLRGCIDGDGSIGTFMHPESRHPQIRVRLCSASIPFLDWTLESVRRICNVPGGHIYLQEERRVAYVSFATSDSLLILKKMYYAKGLPALSRKRSIAMQLLGE